MKDFNYVGACKILSKNPNTKRVVDGKEHTQLDYEATFTACFLAFDAVAMQSLYEMHGILMDSRFFKRGVKKALKRLMKCVNDYEVKRREGYVGREDYIEDYCYYIVKDISPRYKKFRDALYKFIEKSHGDIDVVTCVNLSRQFVSASMTFTDIQREVYRESGVSISDVRDKLNLDKISKNLDTLIEELSKEVNIDVDFEGCEALDKLAEGVYEKITNTRFVALCEAKAEKTNR